MLPLSGGDRGKWSLGLPLGTERAGRYFSGGRWSWGLPGRWVRGLVPVIVRRGTWGALYVVRVDSGKPGVYGGGASDAPSGATRALRRCTADGRGPGRRTMQASLMEGTRWRR